MLKICPQYSECAQSDGGCDKGRVTDLLHGAVAGGLAMSPEVVLDLVLHHENVSLTYSNLLINIYLLLDLDFVYLFWNQQVCGSQFRPREI